MGHQKPKQGQAQAPEQRKQSEREIPSEAPLPGPTLPWFQQQQILLAQRTIGNRQVVRRISSTDLRRVTDATMQPLALKKPLVEDAEEESPPPVKNPDAVEIDLSPPPLPGPDPVEISLNPPPLRGTQGYPAVLPTIPPEKSAKAKEEADKRRAALPTTPAVLMVDPQGTAYSEQEADERRALPTTPAVLMVDSGVDSDGKAYAPIAALLQQVEHNAKSRQALLPTSKDKLTPYLSEFPRVVAILKAIRRTRGRLESGDIDIAADLIAAMKGKKGDLTILAGAIDREPDLSELKACINSIDDVSRLTELLSVTKPARINPSELLQLSANAQQWLNIFAQIDKPDQIILLATALTPDTLASLVGHAVINGESALLGRLTPLGKDSRLAQWLTIAGSIDSLLDLFKRCGQDTAVLGQLFAWVPDAKKLKELLTKVNDDATLLGTLSQTSPVDQVEQLIQAYTNKQKTIDLTKLKNHVAQANDDGAYLAALHAHKVNQGDLPKFLEVPRDQHDLVAKLLPYEKDFNQIQELLKVSVVNEPDFLELFKQVGDSKALLGMLEAIDTKASPLQSTDLKPLIALKGKVGSSQTVLELVKAVGKNQLAQIPAMLDQLSPEDLAAFAKNAKDLGEITALLNTIHDTKQLKKIINSKLKVAQLTDLIEATKDQQSMLSLAAKVRNYHQIQEFLKLESDVQTLLNLTAMDNNSTRLLSLLKLAGSTQTLRELFNDEKDAERLLKLLELAGSAPILQQLFTKDKDHARLEESLQLLRNAGEANGQLLLDMLTQLGATQVAMAPNDLLVILKPLLSDGLTGPQVQTICTKLAEDGKSSAEIQAILTNLRGNLTAFDPNKPNDPATKPITNVPQQTAQDIQAGKAAPPAGKQVLGGAEILDSVNDATAANRGAATVDTHFPTGEAIANYTPDQLWSFCALANPPNPAETQQQARIRQKLALRALMELPTQNADVVQAIFAHNEGQAPRAIFPPDVEDALGSALGAHIVDRHVLNGGGAVGTQQDVVDRAMGQGKFANTLAYMQNSPAGAFNNTAAAQNGMQSALQQRFPWGSPAWIALRGDMVTGTVDLFDANIAGVNSQGYVAWNQNNAVQTTNAPTGVHLRLKLKADAPGGFFVHSAWPVR